ncbi:uncharacterized protein G2W53_040778 [Senna tora]|uniref:Uncharacterized protein n=1 Tax=Senna tora TaxID=362788 RepID=A0A834VY83_9FABA|nr:uncharacterized protein G2W53_040778 [Senna tora]
MALWTTERYMTVKTSSILCLDMSDNRKAVSDSAWMECRTRTKLCSTICDLSLRGVFCFSYVYFLVAADMSENRKGVSDSAWKAVPVDRNILKRSGMSPSDLFDSQMFKDSEMGQYLAMELLKQVQSARLERHALFKEIELWKSRAATAEGERHFAKIDHEHAVGKIKQLQDDNKSLVLIIRKMSKRIDELDKEIASSEAKIKSLSKVGFRGSDPSESSLSPMPPKFDGDEQCNRYDWEEDKDTNDAEAVPETP